MIKGRSLMSRHYREPEIVNQPQLVGQYHIMRKLFFTVFAFEGDVIGAFFSLQSWRTPVPRG